MHDQFERTIRLIGHTGIARLQSAHIIVAGLGGVGGACAEALARGGIGHLTLIDCDIVQESNLNRQLIALHSTVGIKKTEAAKMRLLDINPRIELRLIDARITRENADSFIDASADYLIDAIDSVSAKIGLITAAMKHGQPVLSCMGTGNKTDPGALRFTDLYSTSVCPLCRVMRRELKKEGVSALTVLYSPEPPLAIHPDLENLESAEDARTPGSLSFVPPVAGMMLAGYAIRSLLQTAEPTLP